MNQNPNYEPAPEFPADAYRINGWPGVAFSIYGWETEPDANTEWTGIENRTGQLVAVMVGDDRRHLVDPEDVTPLAYSDYCPECGQIGCRHGR